MVDDLVGNPRPRNGHKVMDKADREGLLDHVLRIASQSLAL